MSGFAMKPELFRPFSAILYLTARYGTDLGSANRAQIYDFFLIKVLFLKFVVVL